MLLIIHLFIALASIAYTTLLLIRPSRSGFAPAYALVTGTLLSGTLLVITTHAPLLQACTSGLVYLAIVSAGIAWAHHRLTGHDH